ncbi:ribonuclease M5 [Bacillus fonticola]|uniref:ribonuclease M5 n=1 Tax=Bacillus fonticola TaxID=2728853 RepID=UPI0014733DDA|nr:ribonuclease M5 [Bacillus fonticola]
MTTKRTLQEIIVVEGKDDTKRIKLAVNADTIETNGSAIGEEVLERIRLAQETRGVIIFTDPDTPGQKIRHVVSQAVPGCKHAFLAKEQAIEKYGRGVGVEHASVEAIRQALQGAHSTAERAHGEISRDDLLYAGLLAGPGARNRREALGRELRIGYANGKQLHKRLAMFQIPKQRFLEALEKIERRP